MKKRITLIIFLLITMIATTVFASAKATDVTMSVVEDNVCTIKLNESASFEKKLIETDLTKKEVTLQLKVNNAAKSIIPSGEMMLVIDSSSSMDEVVNGTTTSMGENYKQVLTGNKLDYSWSDLPVYEAGKEITYTVKEVGEENGKIAGKNGEKYTVEYDSTGMVVKTSNDS